MKAGKFKLYKAAAGRKKQHDKIRFRFDMDEAIDGLKEIEYFKVSCAVCMKAEYVKERNTIEGVLDLSKAQSNYKPGKTPVQKSITVFYKDGQNELIAKDETKNAGPNKHKLKDALFISAVVVK